MRVRVASVRVYNRSRYNRSRGVSMCAGGGARDACVRVYEDGSGAVPVTFP